MLKANVWCKPCRVINQMILPVRIIKVETPGEKLNDKPMALLSICHLSILSIKKILLNLAVSQQVGQALVVTIFN